MRDHDKINGGTCQKQNRCACGKNEQPRKQEEQTNNADADPDREPDQTRQTLSRLHGAQVKHEPDLGRQTPRTLGYARLRVDSMGTTELR